MIRFRIRDAIAGNVPLQADSASQSASALSSACCASRAVKSGSRMSVGATPSSTIDPHVLAVLPEVDECRASAIRPAVEVDAVVAEDRADVVQIVHRNVCRVEANVGVIAFEAPAKPASAAALPRSSRSELAPERQFKGLDFPVPR